MKNQLGINIQTFTSLSKKQIAAVKRFVSQCNKSDGYISIFYWSSIENRKNPGINEILCYAEDDKLVAYAALYHFEAHELEITLMIDPAYRNTEFYTLLWEQIKQAMAQCPILVTRFVFTLNQSCPFKEFLQGLGASVCDSTYKLGLTNKQFTSIKPLKNCGLTFRKAVRADIPALFELEANEFQVSELDYKDYLLQLTQDPYKEIIVAIRNKKIVGKVHVHLSKKTAHIYDLGIDLMEQDKGYSNVLIYRALAFLFARSYSKILVDVMDALHLSWYEDFNFTRIATIEHWKMSSQLSPMKEREKQLDAILLNFHSQPVQDQLSLLSYKH